MYFNYRPEHRCNAVTLPSLPARQQEAECERAAMDVKYGTDTKVADSTKAFRLQKEEFDREINTAVRRRAG